MVPMNSRRITVLAAGLALTLAACGTSDSSTPSSEASPTETAPPADAVADDVDTPAEQSDAAQPDTVATEPVDESTRGTDVQATISPTDDEAAPADTEPPLVQPAAPEVGGRALATDVGAEAQFDGNPLPDLVVADVGRSGEANIANLLPSDRPLLLWAWAPH